MKSLKKILINLINIYQNTPLPTHNLCRHYPTCSEYMKESIEEYGSIKGLLLGTKRLFKCNPLGTSGYDPIPKKGTLKI